jgi:hypothetical protein
MGLPTVGMGLLGLLMAPAEAAAFLVIPSLITNIWQFFSGSHRLILVRRTWPMLFMIFLATWACAGLITGAGAGHSAAWLGAALVTYAGMGLANVRLSVPNKYEVWLSPTVGAATGIITGATGCLSSPLSLIFKRWISIRTIWFKHSGSPSPFQPLRWRWDWRAAALFR